MLQTERRSSPRTQHGGRTIARMARKPMESHNFRVERRAWRDSLATAAASDEVFAEELRNFTAWYSRQPGARAPRRPAVAVRAKEVEES